MKPYTEATTLERIEAAARVMGVKLAQSVWSFPVNEMDWNPFMPGTNDGDNRRLQVAMKADLQWMGDQWRAVAHDHMHIYRAEHKNPNDAIMELAWQVDQANKERTK